VEFVSFDIASMDFRKAGSASRALKERLKLIGADAEAIRRAMIAAYEAEMNVVIHSVGGKLSASLCDSRIEVDVVDSGPGIPDIEKAMKPGFSTATAEARALGFGAGLGLPNIKKNSDRLRLTSREGRGTRLSFTVDLRPSQTDGSHPISLHASAELCRDCRACLAACPTKAMRVREGSPSVLEHLCVDCDECIAACPFEALSVRDEVASLDDLKDRAEMVLVVPPALLCSCGADHSPLSVWLALNELGFAQVMVSEPQEEALLEATLAWATERDHPTPAISPCCPAVVNLIELRFPSLAAHLAPFSSPWEAVQTACADRPVAYVVSCPGQRSALIAVTSDSSGEPASPQECLLPSVVRQAVMEKLSRGEVRAAHAGAEQPVLARTDAARPDLGLVDAAQSGPARPAAEQTSAALTVTGATHVTAVLERIEDGLLTDISVVRPFMCDGGCFGSPLFSEDHHLATRRWAQGRTAVLALIPPGICGPSRRTPVSVASSPLVTPRRRPFSARRGVRLDADMNRAIEKLGRLQAIIESLPGRDCGACGAPTCAALAEDVVMQRAEISLCPYIRTADNLEVSEP
jgi:Na+-translocating ferredoxin:NAD+ oxidoreductase RNF subunit RnfB/anti-sigma regulatory factor (Ser/Thr protein kinase)